MSIFQINKDMDRIDIHFKDGTYGSFRNLVSVSYYAEIDELEILHDKDQIDRLPNSKIDHYIIY